MTDDIITLMQSRFDEYRQLRTEAQLDTIDLFTNSFIDQYVFYDINRPLGSTQSDATMVTSALSVAGFVMITMLIHITAVAI